MTITPPAPSRRTLLPLLPSGPHGSRSAMTCHYRCGNACDHPEPNRTTHETMRELVERAVARRDVLRGGAVAGGALVLGAAGATPAAAEPLTRTGKITGGFTPVAPNKRDAVTVAAGYGHHLVIAWGDPVEKGAPAFDVDNLTPAAARKQFGYNCDYVGLLPTGRRSALLVVNHEYTDEVLMFPTGRYDSATRKAIEMAYHGMSVVEVQRRDRRSGAWRRTPVSKTTRNRRIHTDSELRLVGPAAGHERLRTSADPTGRTVLGTLNNCAGGMTPWGTVLSGEENFNQYFDLPEGQTLDPRYTDSYARYGISGSSRGWSEVDSRFDLSAEPHEPFRFGWIVEIDPYEPDEAPVKHTMLGRFKHEGANVVVADNGKVVVYMGDDERGDYIYKFVSRDRMVTGDGPAARRANKRLLRHGTLFVARFSDEAEDPAPEYDGVGRWIPLTSDTESFVEGMSVAEVLIDTRLAADRVAPTKMDRPEDIEVNPVNGRVYCALTNNSRRGTTYPADEANPLTTSMVRDDLGAPLEPATGNRNGYVLELMPKEGRHTARRFTWRLMLVCGDPEAPETYFAGYDKDKVSPISCPDNVAFDPAGNLWVATDGNALGSNDGIFRVPVAGPQRGHVQQFLTVPVGAEACGPLISSGGRSVWCAVQHPGEVDGVTFESPASTWPHTHDFPRPGVIVAYKP